MNTSKFTLVKAVYIAVFLTLSCSTHAQIFRVSDRFYKGFTAGFGQYRFKSKSNFQEIDRNLVRLDGGQLGLVFGNKYVRSEICVLGYYSSVSDIAGTIDLYRHGVAFNFYPLVFVSKRKTIADPYILAGISYNRFKLYGDYLQTDIAAPNSSVTIERYLGRLRQLNGTIGAGCELKIIDDFDFLHLFGEASYAANLTNTFQPRDFRNTNLSNQWCIQVGIRYGSAPR